MRTRTIPILVCACVFTITTPRLAAAEPLGGNYEVTSTVSLSTCLDKTKGTVEVRNWLVNTADGQLKIKVSGAEGDTEHESLRTEKDQSSDSSATVLGNNNYRSTVYQLDVAAKAWKGVAITSRLSGMLPVSIRSKQESRTGKVCTVMYDVELKKR